MHSQAQQHSADSNTSDHYSPQGIRVAAKLSQDKLKLNLVQHPNKPILISGNSAPRPTEDKKIEKNKTILQKLSSQESL